MSMLGIHFFDGTAWHRFSDLCLLAQDWITCVAVDHENRVWLAAQQEKQTRFIYYDGRKCMPYAEVGKGARDAYVRAMLIDREGNLWVGWHSRLGVWVFHSRSGRWQKFTRRNSALPDTDIFSMVIDNQGRVWVGTEEGVTIFTGGESVSYGAVIPGEISPPVRFRDVEDPMTGEGRSKYVSVGKFIGADNHGRVWSTSSFGVSLYTE